ncbi:hypothetical protein DAI22_05g055500 [Oryza sativa Japonica Group]|uniref:Uncharacterized protein n=2 Tax=Oryza TaxID=4527 RepID=I1PSX0_ORYGL|nr:hypothetical protein DAI22_05g055500 [Oryza sativa Japonica Group]
MYLINYLSAVNLQCVVLMCLITFSFLCNGWKPGVFVCSSNKYSMQCFGLNKMFVEGLG